MQIIFPPIYITLDFKDWLKFTFLCLLLSFSILFWFYLCISVTKFNFSLSNNYFSHKELNVYRSDNV